jgi:hypothetical protein
MTRRASIEKARKIFDKLKGISNQLGYSLDVPLNHNIAVRAFDG